VGKLYSPGTFSVSSERRPVKKSGMSKGFVLAGDGRSTGYIVSVRVDTFCMVNVQVMWVLNCRLSIVSSQKSPWSGRYREVDINVGWTLFCLEPEIIKFGWLIVATVPHEFGRKNEDSSQKHQLMSTVSSLCRDINQTRFEIHRKDYGTSTNSNLNQFVI
jgi:hypothetical protein